MQKLRCLHRFANVCIKIYMQTYAIICKCMQTSTFIKDFYANVCKLVVESAIFLQKNFMQLHTKFLQIWIKYMQNSRHFNHTLCKRMQKPMQTYAIVAIYIIFCIFRFAHIQNRTRYIITSLRSVIIYLSGESLG